MFVFAVCFFYELSKWACETTRTRDVDSLALDLWPIQDTFRLCVGQDIQGCTSKMHAIFIKLVRMQGSTRVSYLHLIKQDRFPRNSHHRHA